MNEWAVIVSTYGNSKFRLTKTIESIVGGTKMPYDLWIRGASEDYWQQCEQREVADKFGANFMECARWRHWDLANCVKTVKNPMIAFVKDDIIFQEGWLDATDYFWKNNPQIPIASVGPVFIEAWELLNVGFIKDLDEMWDIKLDITRFQLNTIALSKNVKFHTAFPLNKPLPYMGTCPFAYTIKREDFFNWNGPYYAGPGDTTVIYGYLGLLHGKFSFYLNQPTVIHRIGRSSTEWWEYHKDIHEKARQLIWWSEELDKDFQARWKMTWKDFQITACNKFNEEVVKYDFSNLKYL